MWVGQGKISSLLWDSEEKGKFPAQEQHFSKENHSDCCGCPKSPGSCQWK